MDLKEAYDIINAPIDEGIDEKIAICIIDIRNSFLETTILSPDKESAERFKETLIKNLATRIKFLSDLSWITDNDKVFIDELKKEQSDDSN